MQMILKMFLEGKMVKCPCCKERLIPRDQHWCDTCYLFDENQRLRNENRELLNELQNCGYDALEAEGVWL